MATPHDQHDQDREHRQVEIRERHRIELWPRREVCATAAAKPSRAPNRWTAHANKAA